MRLPVSRGSGLPVSPGEDLGWTRTAVGLVRDLLIAGSRPGRSAMVRGTAGKEVTVVRVDITCDLMDDPPVGGMACTDGGIWHVHRADGSPVPIGRQRPRRSLRLPQPIRFMIDIIFDHSNGLNASWIRRAKWGATADSFQATLSHCQPPSMQLDPTSGDLRPPPSTHRRCLLSSGSRVRILPGAQHQNRSSRPICSGWQVRLTRPSPAVVPVVCPMASAGTGRAPPPRDCSARPRLPAAARHCRADRP
jgi:hypothetical protein